MKTWSLLIATWGGIFGCIGYEVYTPDSHWMTFDKMFVHDAAVGESPQISVNMKFNTKFVVRWHAIIRQARSGAEGDFIGACSTDGEAEVSPERKFPPSIDVDWWMNPAKCHLQPGVFYVETVFKWSTILGDRTIDINSNAFHITP